MCILFMHLGSQDPDSDYHVVLAANRDELYDRPALNMAPWTEDPHIIGGRDLEAGGGGTWIAVSPQRKKIGALLNLPYLKDPKAKTTCKLLRDNTYNCELGLLQMQSYSKRTYHCIKEYGPFMFVKCESCACRKARGQIVQDYMKSTISTKDYVEQMRDCFKACNCFVFVTVELSENPAVFTYSNFSDKLGMWSDTDYGFSNSQPEKPLLKAVAGKEIIKEICNKYKSLREKDKLVEELTKMLKSEKRYFPDPQLEAERLLPVEQLSSIFVKIPELRYGTRTHTIVLVTKTGHMQVIEQTLQEPVDMENPLWQKSEFQFKLDGLA